MKKLLAGILGWSLLMAPALADEPKENRSLEAVEFIGAYGTADLDRQEDAAYYPFFVSFDFALKPVTRKINIDPASMLQFVVEPFFTYIDEPSANIELGNTFYIKTGFVPETWAVQPYLKVGAGFTYMTLHTYEQGSQLNFIEQGVAGFHFFFTPRAALNLEYRARHLSNGDSSRPNRGVNSFYYAGGFTFTF